MKYHVTPNSAIPYVYDYAKLTLLKEEKRLYVLEYVKDGEQYFGLFEADFINNEAHEPEMVSYYTLYEDAHFGLEFRYHNLKMDGWYDL